MIATANEAKAPGRQTSPESIATVKLYPAGNPKYREFSLWYFASLMLIWNVLGHTQLGFEQQWAAPVTALVTAIALQLLFEFLDARDKKREIRFLTSFRSFCLFVLPAAISGFAVGMLLYPNDNLWMFAFGSAVAIGSKLLFRLPGNNQHFLNPSNAGIAVTLLLFPDLVGAAPPYHFVENVQGVWNWLLPAIILGTGIFVHSRATGRLPLILAWLIAFAAQALVRSALFAAPPIVLLMPMTSTAFTIFTLYMVPDPGTTPINQRSQILFGAGVAIIYGTLQALHVSFGIFLALVLVSLIRGVALTVSHWQKCKSLKNNEPMTPVAAVSPARCSSSVRAASTSDLRCSEPAREARV